MRFLESKNFRYPVVKLSVLLCCILCLVTQPFAQKSRFQARLLTPTASVPPIVVPVDTTCADLNASTAAAFAHIISNNGLSLNVPPPVGTSSFNFQASSDLLTVIRTGNSINFTSARSITAVIVRDGADANAYSFNPPVNGDTSLVTPQNGLLPISSVSFCFGNPGTVTIVKQVSTDEGGTSSTINFPFSAVGNFGLTTFPLVDQNFVGPDRKVFSPIFAYGAANAISVAELEVNGWTLSDISCTESVSENSQINLGGRSVNVIVEDGEDVTCVFTNTRLAPTAAASVLSGRVTTWDGRGISGANVIVTNAFTTETRSVITSPFGYYTVDGLESGFFYFVRVSAKRQKFVESVKTVTLNDSVDGLDFVANP
jgi:hypothetical protein